MKIQVLKVSPQMAQDWLARNTINRKLRKSHVQAFARAINAGDWRLTHQGVAFGASGALLDGQHRLHAIIETGKTLELVVAVGLDDASFKAIDTGAILRTTADVLSVSSSKAALYNFFALLMRADASRKVSVPEAEGAAAIVGPFVDELMDFCSTCRKRLAVTEVRAGAVVAMMESGDSDYVKLMYRSLVLSQFEDMTPVVRSLYRQLVETRVNSNKQNRDVFARAFYAFIPENADKKNIQIHTPAPYVARARDVCQEHESRIAKAADSVSFLEQLKSLERAAA